MNLRIRYFVALFCPFLTTQLCATAETAKACPPIHLKKGDSVNSEQAPILYAIAQACRLNAESEADDQTKAESQELAFNLLSHVAHSKSSLNWLARAYKMQSYLNGEGVAYDPKKAFAMVNRIAKQTKDLSAQHLAEMRLGQMLCLGQGTLYNNKLQNMGMKLLAGASDKLVNEQAALLAIGYMASMPSLMALNGFSHIFLPRVDHLAVSSETKELLKYVTVSHAIPKVTTVDELIEKLNILRQEPTTREPAIGALQKILFSMFRQPSDALVEAFKAHNEGITKQLAKAYMQSCISELQNDQIQYARQNGFGLQMASLLGKEDNTRELLSFLSNIQAHEPIQVRSEFEATVLFQGAFNLQPEHLALTTQILEGIADSMNSDETPVIRRLFSKFLLSLVFAHEEMGRMYFDRFQRAARELDGMLAIEALEGFEERETDAIFPNAQLAAQMINTMLQKVPDVAPQIHQANAAERLNLKTAVIILRDYFMGQAHDGSSESLRA